MKKFSEIAKDDIHLVISKLETASKDLGIKNPLIKNMEENMAESTFQPPELYLDIVKNGSARILASWDIIEETRQNEDESTYTMYVFEEKVIWWSLPLTYTNGESTITIDATSRESVEAYIAANATDIMGYAQQAKISW